MSGSKEAYVCPRCKRITLKETGKAIACECGYLPVRFGDYHEDRLNRMSKEEVNEAINNYLFNNGTTKDGVIFTEKYNEWSKPYISEEKFEKYKRKDFSAWNYMYTIIPIYVIATIFFTLSGGILPFLMGAAWILMVAYFQDIGVRIKKERERREVVIEIEQENQRNFEMIRSTDKLGDLPVQKIEEKYIKIGGWSRSKLAVSWSPEKQRLYLDILYSVMERMQGHEDNFVVTVTYDDCIKVKNIVNSIWYAKDERINREIRRIFKKRLSKDDIYNWIMNNDVTYYFDMDKEEIQ